MNLDVRVDLRPAQRALGDLTGKQIPFAAAFALTTLAQGVQAAETAEEMKTFENPTPFTQRAFGKTPATKRNLVATVFIKDVQAQYLVPYVEGGARFLGTKKGMLAPRAVALNQYGNLTKGKLASLKGKPNVFIGPIKTKAGMTINGVWQRQPARRSAKGVTPAGPLKLLIRFEDTTEAPKHLDFYGCARGFVTANAQRVFDDALRKAMSTARR